MMALDLLLLMVAIATPAQPYESADEFTAAVRAATARYHDRAVAVAEGYRLIGRDFPGMGEHWINIGLIFDGRLEPTRPEFLSYVTVAGVPRLVGVAYAVPLLPGESPPAWPWADVTWHDHARTVDEETLLPHADSAHDGHGPSHPSSARTAVDEPRLAMAHAWVWLRNPQGDFASDNWALPYFRLGLTTPEGAPVASARALSLLTGGADYISEVARAGGHASPAREAAFHRSVIRAQRSVVKILDRCQGSSLAPAQLVRLAQVWCRLWKELDRALTPSTRTRMRPLR